MSTRTSRVPVGIRTNRRRKAAIDLDLNRVPATEHSTARNPIAENPSGENREQERRLTQLGPQEVEVQANQQQEVEVQANQLQLVVQPEPTLIDVEAIDDDDVVLSSPRAFAEAKNNSRRNRGRTVVDVDLVMFFAEEQIRLSNNNRNKRRRESPKRSIFNCDLYINLDASSSNSMESVKKPPEPPKEPVFTCPICMGPMVEEMSTRCGHIFCKSCIKAAISAQAKCPTCRKKITVKELIRVFLPTTA